MLTCTFLLLLSTSTSFDAWPAPQPAQDLAVREDLKEEYDRRRAEAKGDTKKLWALADWCEANSMDKERRSCLRAVLKLDDSDRKAHEALGHVFYDGQWFTTQKKLDAYKKKEEERKAKEEGLVRYKGEWVHPDDIANLEKGLVKTATGEWVDPEVLKRIEEGWRQQDLTWVPPAEFEQLDQGLWKCGDKWLNDAEADKYHSRLGRWWTIPSDHFHLYTTLPRQVALQALDEIERTFRDLSKIYGKVPNEPIRVLLLRSTEQYNVFAAGDGFWVGTDALGLSSVHGAFFADGWFAQDERKWMGAGAGYWDFESETGANFGKLFARHAAGQSYGSYVDPSPETVAAFERGGEFNVQDFYSEKKLPTWFRYGAASYAERYYTDAFVGTGGDPHWARKWAVSNIARRGGLDNIDRIFEMDVRADNPDSDKLISQAGLLIAYMVDGKNAELKKHHGAVKAAIRSGEGIDKAFKDLQKALKKDVDGLRMFADL